MKATAMAPANIALIKYWGKKDEKLRLPLNSSISINLSEIFTCTTVEYADDLAEDLFLLDQKVIQGKERERVVVHLNNIRKLAGIKLKARVESKNNFPKGTGLASSASGFAALTLASAKAAGLDLSEKQLSVLARIGSGSACRSISSGFVEWKQGVSHSSSYAYSLYPPEYWDVADVVAVVGEVNKSVPSTQGQTLAQSSPFLEVRLSGMVQKLAELKLALKHKDFTKIGNYC